VPPTVMERACRANFGTGGDSSKLPPPNRAPNSGPYQTFTNDFRDLRIPTAWCTITRRAIPRRRKPTST
jgi:hypothetical protein